MLARQQRRWNDHQQNGLFVHLRHGGPFAHTSLAPLPVTLTGERSDGMMGGERAYLERKEEKRQRDRHHGVEEPLRRGPSAEVERKGQERRQRCHEASWPPQPHTCARTARAHDHVRLGLGTATWAASLPVPCFSFLFPPRTPKAMARASALFLAALVALAAVSGEGNGVAGRRAGGARAGGTAASWLMI